MNQQAQQQLLLQQWQVWMPLMLTVFANLVVVLFGVVWNNRHIDSVRNEIGSVRNEMNSLRGETASLRSEVIARIALVDSRIEALRAETRQSIAEAELRITKEILELKGRIERIEEQRGLIHQP